VSKLQLWGLASLLSACGSTKTPPPEQQPPTDPVVEQKADSPASGPSDEVVKKICETAPCVGQFARLVVLRDADGKVGKIRFEGDLQSCSHPPWIYFDANGVEVVTIPLEPVEPGSARQQELDAKQASALQGLTEAEELSCPDARAPK
jgi:hypothetical protein